MASGNNTFDFLFDDHSSIWSSRGCPSSKVFTNQSQYQHQSRQRNHSSRRFPSSQSSHDSDQKSAARWQHDSTESRSASSSGHRRLPAPSSRFIFPPLDGVGASSASSHSSSMQNVASGKSSPSLSISEKSYRTCRKTLLDAYIDRDHPDYWPNRVTLKIDVAFTDHSHIIGRGGRSQKQIMKDTGCHVHFPDSNRNPDLEKSNMVSIAGPLLNVEKARHELRNASPLVVTFELKNFYGDFTELTEDAYVYELASRYGVNILVRHNRSSGQPFVVVRGSVHQESDIKDAMLMLQQHYLRTTKASCKTSLEILPPQQPAVCGAQNSNILLISELTGATIYHPENLMAGATTFFIQGTIEAVLSARQYLLGCLPIQLQFDVHQELSDDVLAELSNLERRFRLQISLRPKRHGETKQSILIRGFEYQISSIYSVRRLVLEKDEHVVATNDYDFMLNFHNTGYLGSTVTTPLIQPPLTVNSLIMNSGSIHQPLFNAMPAALFAMPSPFMQFGQHFNGVMVGGDENACSSSTLSRPSTTSFSALSSSRASPDDLQTAGAANNLQASSSNGSEMSTSTASSVSTNLQNDPVPEEAPLASCLLETAKKFEEKAAAANRWKAPGAERDWVHEKVLANKAMQETPIGPRMPNDYWAGLGFSRSMPAEVIRNRMQRENGVLQKSSNLKELVEEEDEDKIGPWPLDKKPIGEVTQRKGFNATTYLDSPFSNGVSLCENDDIVTLLTKLDLSDLSKYIDIFREQEIDTKLFLTMNEEDLKDVGVNTFGSRRKMLKAISEINERKKRIFA